MFLSMISMISKYIALQVSAHNSTHDRGLVIYSKLKHDHIKLQNNLYVIKCKFYKKINRSYTITK